MSTIDRYAVFGNPIAHSMSPAIHQAFARQCGHKISYTRQEVPLDGFAAAATEFFAGGGSGINVTVPFKLQAWRWVTEHDQLALTAQAVNTILPMGDNRFIGCNTDGLGLRADLQRLGVPLNNARVVLLGAGGAVRGVVQALLDAQPALLTIANRTASKAQQLVDEWHNNELRNSELDHDSVRDRLTACDLDAVTDADVVINGTSAGLDARVPLLPAHVARAAFCYDMMYGRSTAFCEWSAANGASGVADGLGMLVEQAAHAFRLWRHAVPDTAPVLADLRQRLNTQP